MKEEEKEKEEKETLNQTRAASAADPEPVCYTDDFCLEWRGKSDTVNGKETTIAFTQKKSRKYRKYRDWYDKL